MSNLFLSLEEWQQLAATINGAIVFNDGIECEIRVAVECDRYTGNIDLLPTERGRKSVYFERESFWYGDDEWCFHFAGELPANVIEQLERNGKW